MGKIEVKVTVEPIAHSQVASWSPDSHHGAMNSFIGIVRSTNLGRTVVAMEYDCFIPLCEKTLFDIAAEAKEKWSEDANIFIVHRHGKLEVGEASVAITATTRHRDESYRITRYIIEELKTRAPIWKKEYYQDGETDWVRGHALCQHRKVDHHEHGGSPSCGGKIHSHETR
ncbi:MAG: molybdenum cofactor biosynthesis protein MoaE [Bdellovibrionaceae bacterium]|nr:molybdenum cofactor biosynthesis protein MoaE [Pseudobdellovibrionaceae bacterium]